MQNTMAAKMIKEPCVAIQVIMVFMMFPLVCGVVLSFNDHILSSCFISYQENILCPLFEEIKRIPATCHSREDMK